eukprot:5778387-Lingulodinium_polyedra.AAC.1
MSRGCGTKRMSEGGGMQPAASFPCGPLATRGAVQPKARARARARGWASAISTGASTSATTCSRCPARGTWLARPPDKGVIVLSHVKGLVV